MKQVTLNIGGEDILLTRNWLTEHAIKGNKILLIKAYRDVSGDGLKDSKETIERYQIGSLTGLENSYSFDINGIISLFSAYIEGDIEALKSSLKDGIDCAINNFVRLGFANPFDAIRMVVDNLEKNS